MAYILPAEIMAELRQKDGADWRFVLRLIKKDLSSLYFSSRTGIAGTENLVLEWGALSASSIFSPDQGLAPLKKMNILISREFLKIMEELNSTGGLENLKAEIYLFKGEKGTAGYGLENYGLSPYGSPNPAYFALIFSGIIASPIEWDQNGISITLKDLGASYQGELNLNLIRREDFPQAKAEVIGLAMPRIFGQVKGFTPIPVRVPAITRLKADMDENDTIIPCQSLDGFWKPEDGVFSHLLANISAIATDGLKLEYNQTIYSPGIMPCGYVKIGREIIRYRQAIFDQVLVLNKLNRGCFGTPREEHFEDQLAVFGCAVQLGDEVLIYDRNTSDKLILAHFSRKDGWGANAFHRAGEELREYSPHYDYLINDPADGQVQRIGNLYLMDDVGEYHLVPAESYHLPCPDEAGYKPNLIRFMDKPLAYSSLVTNFAVSMNSSEREEHRRGGDGNEESYVDIYESDRMVCRWYRDRPPFSSPMGKIALVRLCIKYANPENPLRSPKIKYVFGNGFSGQTEHSLREEVGGPWTDRFDITNEMGWTADRWDWLHDFNLQKDVDLPPGVEAPGINYIEFSAEAGEIPADLRGVSFTRWLVNGVWHKVGWACGERGKILFYNDITDRWTEQDSKTDQDLFAIFALEFKGEARAWAVGAEQTILFFNGREWERQHQATSGILFGVWGFALSEGLRAYAVGSANKILYFDGNIWVEDLAPPGNADLRAISGSSRGDIWICGDQGTIYRNTKGGVGGWENYSEDAGLRAIWQGRGKVEDLRGVHACRRIGGGQLIQYFCGTNGCIIKRTGSGSGPEVSYEEVGVDIPETFNGIYMVDEEWGREGAAVSDGARVYYSPSGNQFKFEGLVEGSNCLFAVSGMSELAKEGIRLVGDRGNIFAFDRQSERWRAIVASFGFRYTRIYEVWLEIVFYPHISDAQTLVADVNGIVDNQRGEFTGKPLSLIENPADVIRYVAQRIIGIPQGNIDAAAFDRARRILAGWGNGWRFAGALTERMDAELCLAKLAKQAGAFLFWDLGKLSIKVARYISKERSGEFDQAVFPQPVCSFDGSNIIKGSFKGGRTDMRWLVNDLKLLLGQRYAVNRAVWQEIKGVVVPEGLPLKKIDFSSFKPQKRYDFLLDNENFIPGESDLVPINSQKSYRCKASRMMEADFINDQKFTANYLFASLNNRLGRIYEYIQFQTYMIGYPLKAGDFIEVSHPLYPAGCGEGIKAGIFQVVGLQHIGIYIVEITAVKVYDFEFI